ncbi:MAG TPA: pyridoxamine 5'-phosphate oxidase family protein [Vineibacter sp.]|nr:pyridoxamine 5'-phosphate oxidase family protein [Vineibacter sp.]
MPDTNTTVLEADLPSAPELLDAAAARQLVESAYPAPSPGAVAKNIGRIDRHMRSFIEMSPFCCLATSDDTGRLDVTPRGDKPGFVKVLDEKTLALPDRPGNNRLDSLRNVLVNPGVGLLFMIPGFEETVRVNGTAQLSIDPRLLAGMVAEGKTPRSALVIDVREAYLHCAKAFRRSRLWDPAAQRDRALLPSLSVMIGDQLKLPSEGTAEREQRLEDAYRKTMW